MSIFLHMSHAISAVFLLMPAALIPVISDGSSKEDFLKKNINKSICQLSVTFVGRNISK